MKESTAAYEKTLAKMAKDNTLKMLSKDDKKKLVKIAKLLKHANESVSEGKIKIGQQFNADGVTWKVVKVGATQSRATAITKSVKGKVGTYDNKTIRKFVESKSVNEAPDHDMFKALHYVNDDIFRIMNKYDGKANMDAVFRSWMLGLHSKLKKAGVKI